MKNFKDFLNENNLSLIGRIPIDSSIALGSDRGNPVVVDQAQESLQDVFSEIAKEKDARLKKNKN